MNATSSIRYSIVPVAVAAGGAARALAREAVSACGRIRDTVYEWQYRAAVRSRLATLDDRLLADIGLTREQVDAEACKPFWRA